MNMNRKRKRISLKRMAVLVYAYNTVAGSRVDERKLLGLVMKQRPVFVK